MARDREPCVHGGLPEEEHHSFQAPGRPSEACVCDAGTWGNPSRIPPVCDGFTGTEESYCLNCEHDMRCHPSLV
jgi:hypothetical protein